MFTSNATFYLILFHICIYTFFLIFLKFTFKKLFTCAVILCLLCSVFFNLHCLFILYILILVRRSLSVCRRSTHDQIKGIQKTGVILIPILFSSGKLYIADSEAVQLVCLVLMYRSKEANTTNKGFWTKYKKYSKKCLE